MLGFRRRTTARAVPTDAEVVPEPAVDPMEARYREVES